MEVLMIFRFKTDYMRYINRLVSRGYFYWIAGEMDTEPHYKIVSMLAKFDERYSVNASPQQRFRRRQKELASVQFLAWFCVKNLRLYWILLATEGQLDEGEVFQDSRLKKQRIRLEGYELKRQPRKGMAPALSWAMTRETYEYWHSEIRLAIRQRDDRELRQIWYSLRRVAGFRSLRKQVYRLQSYAVAEWKRSRRGDYTFEKIFVGWVGKFQKAETLSLDELRNATKNARNAILRRFPGFSISG
ncbi:hypothetical protein PJO24_004976 [Salmonella enterica]|nr:hypothetical protein [Salmonella enterica]